MATILSKEPKIYTPEVIKDWKWVQPKDYYSNPHIEITFDDGNKYTFVVYGGTNTGSLGCHCGTISGILLTSNGFPYPKDKIIEVPEDLKEKITDYIVLQCTYSQYLISDAVNRGAPSKDKNNHKLFSTTDFVLELIRRKIGVVYAGPMVFNPFHDNVQDVSLGQSFIWVPESRKTHIMPGSGRVYNYNGINREEWAKNGVNGAWTWKDYVENAFPKQPNVLFDEVRIP